MSCGCCWQNKAVGAVDVDGGTKDQVGARWLLHLGRPPQAQTLAIENFTVASSSHKPDRDGVHWLHD